ncbi:MMPL family transporter [Streptomyces sp. WAC05374]|uniref:MMPL family transporter n=1 Tax=Streptomyces sp. WAC05374 TaxID=2487420 RepID=UPI000F8600A3|nr:MMPL family transporter [Streptomyces sp. WAC05374]RST14639.1 MMPL family transporter [Streptomyces sp. WAC05374]TDF50239.1 MMPL family transporter [Streptomyces sp. WAC05374]TDF57963.1 MMPL family transporter [Streptomyces sp. WAC05374]TDF60492.1 MMPL family transporter [Streptomyces sp. WAC05374]
MKTAQRRARWLVPLVLLLVWLGIGGTLGPYAGKLGEVATNDQAAFLPRSAESTQVLEARRAFDRAETLPAIVVWTADGDRVSEAQRAAATRAVTALAGDTGVVGRPSPALPSDDGKALQAVVPLEPGLGDELPAVLDQVRRAADGVPDTTARIAGPAASQADLSDAFSGIDGLLLAVALGAVLVILLLVYRSVLLPFLIIIGSVFALGLACAVVYALADRNVVRVDGQVQGILSILVIGAATDYALLLTARFREELAVRGDRVAAAVAAVRRSAGAITASAATVALGLLALLASDLTNNRALGPVGAIGIVCAVLSSLTFLPAVLALLGRSAFWPSRPKASDATVEGHAVWRRVAAKVDARPRRVWLVTALVLGVFAAFAPSLTSKGVPLDEIFVRDAPSVTAQETLGRHFPGGSGNPAVIIADADRAEQVTAAARNTGGVASVTAFSGAGRPGSGEPLVVDGRVRIDATLEAAADSDAAKETVQRLRDTVHAVPDADALVGGYTAQQYDTQQTAARDQGVIVPVVLGIILLILVVLLRSLLVPVLLVATVGLNFLATLGVSALVFEHLLGFSGTDASVPLYGFVFLVALGVDYNIFLMSRVREEALTHGPRQGVLRGLTTTGGVITSAGVVLAVTFAALMVIPLAFLVQIAFIVAFGVLLDTLVVRSLLVPALVIDIGPRAWWPTSFGRESVERPAT